MRIKLERQEFQPKCTIGELFVDGCFECYTLEDVVRQEKVYGETAIPYGTYEIDITRSNRFKRDLPLLKDVPNFSGIRIHPGNTDADTEGCILVGRTKGNDFVGESRAAFAALFTKIREAIDQGDTVTIDIEERP